VKWESGPAVFSNAPGWVAENVPANRRLDYWAPDIARVGERYLLYYSASSFGKNTSGIGLASNPTLDPNDPTSWLYSALDHEQHNRINEAIRDLEQSQELNDNRSLYRSDLLLDQDRAVRSANVMPVKGRCA